MISFGPCACIGALYGEPHCYCEMMAKGLPLNEDARAKSEAELKRVLGEVFGWPGSPMSDNKESHD